MSRYFKWRCQLKKRKCSILKNTLYKGNSYESKDEYNEENKNNQVNQVNQIVVGEEMVGGDKVDRQIIQIFEFYKM